MSNKPSRPIKECIADFNAAVEANDFDKLDAVEKELDDSLRKRLKRLSYEGYPIKQLDYLITLMPEDFSSKHMNRLFEIADSKTPAERMAELGYG